MTPFSNSSDIQTAAAPAPAPPARLCPRCRANLVVVHQQLRWAERVSAIMCPSVTCGYKIIVPR